MQDMIRVGILRGSESLRQAGDVLAKLRVIEKQISNADPAQMVVQDRRKTNLRASALVVCQTQPSVRPQLIGRQTCCCVLLK